MDGTFESGGDDPAPIVEALRRRTDGPLYSVVRFDPDNFRILHVAGEAASRYPTESAMVEHFERIFAYVGIDFAEKTLFSDVLLPDAGTVRYMTTSLDSVKVVRIYEESEGIFLGVDPEEAVPPLVDAVGEHLFEFRDR